MHDAPTPAQLIGAVADFLRAQAAPALARGQADPHAAYLARVAANALGIAQRQWAEAPALAAQERERLCALLGVADEPGTDLAALTQRLAGRIADGTLGLETPGLAEHLWAVTLAKLAVDQPDYVTYRRLTAAPGDP